MKAYRIEERQGWERQCPYCNEPIRYTKLSNWYAPVPFFYADESNDVFLRTSDVKAVEKMFVNGTPSIEELEKMWNSILSQSPKAPNGGEFKLWSNIKCPHCKKEFPYNNGVHDLSVRIHDPNVILIDGAIVVGEGDKDSWLVKVTLTWTPKAQT